MYVGHVNDALKNRIVGGSEYCWNCYPKARYLDYKSEYGTASVLFNTETQEVYEATVESDSKNPNQYGPYRWLNPAFKDAMYSEAEQRNVDKDQAWDDVKWIDLETEEDYLEKAAGILDNIPIDTRIVIPIDLDDETFMILAKEAHRRDITFNDICMEAVRDMIDRVERGEITKDTVKDEWWTLPDEQEEDRMDVFTVTVEDAADGSGDGIIQLPDTFIKQEDWREGDVLDWEVTDGRIILKNLSKQEREDGTTS